MCWWENRGVLLLRTWLVRVRSDKISGRHNLKSLAYPSDGDVNEEAFSPTCWMASCGPWRSSDSGWAVQVGQPVSDTAAAPGRREARRAHASPRTGQAVALKAKLNPAQPWQGVCWYAAGAGQALVLGGCSRDLEGMSAAVCRAQGVFSIPCHLAVCSVSPSAHSVLLHSQLPSWGCNSPGLSPEESEGLCFLLTLPCRMTETSALPSAREVYFQPSFYSASSVPWMRYWLGSWVYLQSAWV